MNIGDVDNDELVLGALWIGYNVLDSPMRDE